MPLGKEALPLLYYGVAQKNGRSRTRASGLSSDSDAIASSSVSLSLFRTTGFAEPFRLDYGAISAYAHHLLKGVV